MEKIPTIPSNIVNIDPRSKQQNQIAAVSNFDALLFSSDSNYGFIDEFLGNITRSLNDNFSALTPQGPAPVFAFTEGFESTFGLNGPLPAFITMVTAKLHLSAAQNRAFQEIAVNNKDATKTPASIQKIALELKQAGIGIS